MYKSLALFLCVVAFSHLPDRDVAAAEMKPGVTLFVAVNGDDSWSGTLAEPNATKADGPLATLDRARDRIREMKKTRPLPTGGVTVVLCEGTYLLPRTFRLDAADSGTAEAPIVYRAAEGEKVRIIGGRPITGFVPYRGSILKADVAAQGFKGIYFRQLFFDGRAAAPGPLSELRSAKSLWRRLGVCRRQADRHGTRHPQRKPPHVPVQAERRPELEPARRGRSVCLSALQLVEQHCADRRGGPPEADHHARRRRLLCHPPGRPLLCAESAGGTRRAGRVVSRPPHRDALLLAAGAAGGKTVYAPTMRTLDRHRTGHGARHDPRLDPGMLRRDGRDALQGPAIASLPATRSATWATSTAVAWRSAADSATEWSETTSTRSAATASPSAAAIASRSRPPKTMPTTTTSITRACSTSRAWASTERRGKPGHAQPDPRLPAHGHQFSSAITSSSSTTTSAT